MIEEMMERLRVCDDETYSLFIVLYKLELLLQDIAKQKEKINPSSLRSVDRMLSRHRTAKLTIYSLTPEEKDLRIYFERAVHSNVLEAWVSCPIAALSKQLIIERNKKVERLQLAEKELKRIHAECAKNVSAWSLLMCEKRFIPILEASFIGTLTNIFNGAYHFAARYVPIKPAFQYLFMLCGAALGTFVTYKRGFRSSMKLLLLVYACQNYVKKYNAMRRTDDRYAMILPVPKYILSPPVAIRGITFLLHMVSGFIESDRITLLASTIGFFSSILFVRLITAWNKNLKASQLKPSDSAALLQQRNHLYLLSLCGFYLFGFLPVVCLYQKYGLSVFCKEALHLSETALAYQGYSNIKTQTSPFYSLRFWWSNTITAISMWKNASGDRYQKTCRCFLNATMTAQFDCETPTLYR